CWAWRTLDRKDHRQFRGNLAAGDHGSESGTPAPRPVRSIGTGPGDKDRCDHRGDPALSNRSSLRMGRTASVLGVGFRSGPSLGMAVLRTDHPVEPRWRGRLNRAVNVLTAVAAAEIRRPAPYRGHRSAHSQAVLRLMMSTCTQPPAAD